MIVLLLDCQRNYSLQYPLYCECLYHVTLESKLKLVTLCMLYWPCKMLFYSYCYLFSYTKFEYFSQDKLDPSAHKILTDYHSATVTLLALVAAGTGEVK